MKRICRVFLTAVLAVLLFWDSFLWVHAEDFEAPGNLYAMSAVLMDASSGRVLYEKEGGTARANASTTKVMTCLLAIENAPGDDYVMVSANAAAQPEVRLGLSEGEQYYLEDLLYSLMLKSHNDTAVAIAEHIGGTVEGFADMMNAKAKSLGCRDTHFVTPNGLDASDAGGEHHTTARDLALIMRYAIQNKVFLHVTQTMDYSFSEITGKKHFSVHNANALFEMTEGVLSGKTGYTGNAGYCYVCAVQKEDRCLIVALLGCGWPNHKNYKWKDTLKLLEYGNSAFSYQKIYREVPIPQLAVGDGYTEDSGLWDTIWEKAYVSMTEKEQQETVLLKKDESITYEIDLPETLEAPVKKNQKIGEIHWYVSGTLWRTYPILAEQKIEKKTIYWCALKVFHAYFHS